jgi:hypothetical protein
MTVAVDTLGTVTGTISAQSLGQVVLPAAVDVAGGTLVVGGLSGSMIIGNAGASISSALYSFMEVAQGATLSGYGALWANMDYEPGSDGIPAEVIDDGVGLDVEGLVKSSGFTVYGILAGSGTIDVLPDGYFTAAVTNAAANSLTFDIGSDATLHVSSTPDSGQNIDFVGQGGVAAFYEDDYTTRNCTTDCL